MPWRGALKGGFGDGRELVPRLWDIPQIPVLIKQTTGYRTVIMSKSLSFPTSAGMILVSI